MIEESSMLSIKQFSELSGISESALRYYDKIGLFPPEKRDRNNYRYYLPLQMILVNMISVLSDIGVPLSRIKELVQNRTPEDILSLLREQAGILNCQLKKLQTSYSVVHTFADNIHAGISAAGKEIHIGDMPETRVAFGPPCDWSGNGYFYEPFMVFCKEMKANGNNISYPTGGFFESMRSFLDKPSQPDRFFSLDPYGPDHIPKGRYINAYTRGYYGEMGGIGGRMDAYAGANGLRLQGPVYVRYLLDEISLTDKTSYLSQVSVRIERGRPKPLAVP